MDAVEYSRRKRDSKLENEVAASLRAKSEKQRFEFVQELARLNPHAASVLVRKIQLTPNSLEAFLEHGLAHGDASSVNWWLKATHDGLGPRRFLRVISGHMTDNPVAVFKANYFLARYFPNDEKYQNAVGELRQEFDRRYPDFSPTDSGSSVH